MQTCGNTCGNASELEFLHSEPKASMRRRNPVQLLHPLSPHWLVLEKGPATPAVTHVAAINVDMEAKLDRVYYLTLNKRCTHGESNAERLTSFRLNVFGHRVSSLVLHHVLIFVVNLYFVFVIVFFRWLVID